jgi:hypothetical protein
MMVERSGQSDGRLLKVSDAHHALRAVVPNRASDRHISVIWTGMLGSKSLTDWASNVVSTHTDVTTVMLDRWDAEKEAPKTYAAGELDRFARDLRGFGESTVTVRFSIDDSRESPLYLWGDFTQEGQARDNEEPGEVGLKMDIQEFNDPKGRSILAEVLQISSAAKFHGNDLDKLLNKLKIEVGRAAHA